MHSRTKCFAPTLILAFFIAQVAFAAPRNVILITIDTWRADYLSYNGSTKVKTPNLDRLAKGGANFTRARTSVPLTLPSHASIMTSLYPSSHGVRDNGSFQLADSHRTLAEVLKTKGYVTAAFVGSFVLDHRFGLSQGFDVYDDRTWNQIDMLESPGAERNGESVYKAFQAWWKSTDRSKPFFVWIHLYDPHAPYEPPSSFRAQHKTNPYAGEVAFADSITGRIINDLHQSKAYENSIIAVAGDHGEGLGEHQESSHSVLIYNSTLHVPMILLAPGMIATEKKVDTLTRTIDLVPTVLDYLGFANEFGEGTSLRGAIEGTNVPEIHSYSESLYPQLKLGWSPLYGIEGGKFHFILAPKPELYYLPTDPNETTNRLSEFSQIANQLRSRLAPFLQSKSVERQQLDPEAEEKLRSLGYISGTEPAKTSNVDPKDKMSVWNQMQQAMAFAKYQDCRKSAAIFEEVLAKEKDIPLVYDNLGSCYRTLQQWNKAEVVYRKALDRGLESAAIHMNLGVIYQRNKNFGQAETQIRKAIQQNPLLAEAHYYLGNVLKDQRKFVAAIDSYKESLRLNPDYVYARNALGRTYSILKRDDEALENFRQAVETDPSNAPAYFNLAVQLEKMKRNKEALQSYRKFLSLSSEKELAAERQKAMEAISRLGSGASAN